MAERKENQSVKEITEKLEQGLKELFDSEKFKTYLTTMSKFHNYSFNNTLLIAMQKPDATLVAGFQSWQKNFDRHVNKGEKGIKIMAPAPYKIKQEMDVIDPDTKKPVIGEDGKTKKEEKEITIPAFKPVTVFDVSQTDGKPIPDLGVDELLSTVDDFKDFMNAIEKVAPVPIEYKDIEGGAKGYFSPSEQRIVIQKDMPESQTVKTAVHETAHSLLHDKDHARMDGIDSSEKKTRSTKEVEAESVAYTVCQHFGIDTSEYSFGYLAGWSSGKEMTELKESMDTIRKTASKLITDIEGALKEIKLERQQEADKEIIPGLFVAECAEFHSLGEFHEGITSVEEAKKIYDSIPSERLNGIKSIGIIVSEPDAPQAVMEIDLMVGNAFDLDTLSYVPDITRSDRAMEMVAQLMKQFPEKEILGAMPVELSEKIEALHEKEPSAAYDLAEQIDGFMYDYDTYNYQDQVPDRQEQIDTIAKDLENGEAGYIKQYLAEIVEEQAGTAEQIEQAKELASKVEDYKPLAKIEEQVEENYNHIDDRFNNLKKPSEERKEEAESIDSKQEKALEQADSHSGRTADVTKPKKSDKRPSLKKRLEEKKELVAKEPVRPAPEKTKENGKELI